MKSKPSTISGLWLLFAFWAACSRSGAPPLPDDLEARGAALVDLLVAERFERAFAEFDSTMQGALPLEKLRSVWGSLQVQSGAFGKRLGTRTEVHQQYRIVFVTCDFARARIDVKVVFDSNKKIAGLYFAPAQVEVEYLAPAYVRSDAFREVEVTVGQAPWELPGTLSLPAGEGPHPALVLVHGSGPQDRDETVGGCKPFRDLAWGLASRGIGVLRYEKRTRQHQSRMGAFRTTITTRQETTDDALHAVALLRRSKGVDPERVFVLGHSLGGMLLPRIGKADPTLAGLVVMAGTSRPLETVVLSQFDYLFSLDGDVSRGEREKLTQLRQQITRVKKLRPGNADLPAPDQLPLGIPASYWLDLRRYHPPALARTLGIPMLVLQGGRDYQVNQADFDGWKAELSGRKDVEFRLYPALNHLFVAGQGKSRPAEYELPGHVDAKVIDDIAKWVLSRRGS